MGESIGTFASAAPSRPEGAPAAASGSPESRVPSPESATEENDSKLGTQDPALPEPAGGLSEAEVVARRARGLGNEFHPQTSRSYLQILRQHAFSFINTVLFAIGIALMFLGRIDDAILTAGMVLLNVIVGVSQEARAKRKLDEIALLTRPKANVIRDGRERAVDPAEIVLGDVLAVRPGDQIVVDGNVVGDARMEADESLLTGESDRVTKRAGDPVYSGSFCVTGNGLYTAGKVGAASLANQITLGARAFRQIKTPLQRDVDFVVRLLVILATLVGVLLAIALLRSSMPVVERVQVAAVIAALVPQGLFAMVTLTYAMGALRMAGKGALIQQINAVESLSNVNVLCLDKTGTLTTNSLKFEELYPMGISEAEMKRTLGDFAASVPHGNRTMEAICAGCEGEARKVREQVPFSSARKWSALSFDEDDLRGVYVLGAPEMLQGNLQPGSDLGPRVKEWSERGLRVLLFAYRPYPSTTRKRSPNCPITWYPSGCCACATSCAPMRRPPSRVSPREACASRSSPETARRRWPRWPGRRGWKATCGWCRGWTWTR